MRRRLNVNIWPRCQIKPQFNNPPWNAPLINELQAGLESKQHIDLPSGSGRARLSRKEHNPPLFLHFLPEKTSQHWPSVAQAAYLPGPITHPPPAPRVPWAHRQAVRRVCRGWLWVNVGPCAASRQPMLTEGNSVTHSERC